MPVREENTNTLVAAVLGKLLGMEVRAETSGRADRRLLDIYIPGNHRVVIEAKYNDFDAAVQAAQERWTNMKPPPAIVGALSYHPDFRNNPKKAIRRDGSIEFALSGERYADLHKFKRIGTVYDLAQALNRPATILHPGVDETEQAVKSIEGALAAFYSSVQNDRGLLHKFAKILQANFESGKEKEILEQSARVAGLILFGAFLFQFALARKDERVENPSADSLPALSAHWEMILKEINYAAIFGVARQILEEGVLQNPLRALLDAARDVRERAEDGTDLMGRIYHRLLADAKPLGAFYTSIPAATLIAGLALSPEDWGDDSQWSDLEFVRKLRIADPACGSGTLLAAACWQLRDNFARADFRARGVLMNGNSSKMDELHKCFMTDVIWGYDILETAAHLTATTLGLMAPDVNFRHAHIHRTIIGKYSGGTATGSLELLEGDLPIFRREKQVETADKPDTLPELDLCIMNPPFVRGQAGNLAYSFLGDGERKEVHKRMNSLGKKHGYSNDKGLGPAFVALACLKRKRTHFIRPGGRLAMILASTISTGMGKAWGGSRAKIEKDFDLEMLIASRESGRPNFSENTNFQECIVIARKRKDGEKPNPNALFVVLSRNPRTAEEALATMRAIKQARNSGREIGDLRLDGDDGFAKIVGNEAGQYAVLPLHNKSAWRGIAFANLTLSLVANSFAAKGSLRPLAKGKVPLKPLNELAILGSHRLDLYLNAKIVKDRRCRLSPTLTPYAAYYPGQYKRDTGIPPKDLRHIAEDPQCYILPLPGQEDWADKWYERAGRIVLCQSFGFSSMRRLAVLVSASVQASHYWPITLRSDGEQRRKAMVLWLNSTPSLLLIANFVQSTQGAKVNLSQAATKELPVLDLDELTSAQLRKLAAVFDEIVAGDGFLPIPQMQNDEARIKIDAAISAVCGLGDLAPLRAALAAEPIITNKPAGAVE